MTQNILPSCVTDYIDLVIKKMRYSRKARKEVRRELTDHFTDALTDYDNQQAQQQAAEKLIKEFGDANILAKLIRRAKKRCRPLWKKTMIRSFQVMGMIVVLFSCYTIWFVSGKPTFSIDYLTELNKIGRPTVVEGENAWPYYEKAIEFYVEPNDSIKGFPDVVRLPVMGEYRKLSKNKQQDI